MSEHDQRVFGIPEPEDQPAVNAEGHAFPEGVELSLQEAPVEAPPGTVGIQVQVNVIMDQIHQHWARQMAEQIQRNAELAAALTAVSEELEEVKGKLTALTEVTNAPDAETSSRVRGIGNPVGRQEEPPIIDHPV